MSEDENRIPFQCAICDVICTSDRGLKVHIGKVHKPKRLENPNPEPKPESKPKAKKIPVKKAQINTGPFKMLIFLKTAPIEIIKALDALTIKEMIIKERQ